MPFLNTGKRTTNQRPIRHPCYEYSLNKINEAHHKVSEKLVKAEKLTKKNKVSNKKNWLEEEQVCWFMVIKGFIT